MKSPVYIICVITLSLYMAVLSLMSIVGQSPILLLLADCQHISNTFSGRVHLIRSDGNCLIGLKLIASIPLLAYDLYELYFFARRHFSSRTLGSFMNVALTILFLWPLFSNKHVVNPSVKRAALRTLWCIRYTSTHNSLKSDCVVLAQVPWRSQHRLYDVFSSRSEFIRTYAPNVGQCSPCVNYGRQRAGLVMFRNLLD